VAGRANGGAKVSNLWARYRDVLSKFLDPAEREAVFGDFAELALTDRSAVKSLVGLVLRRQLRLWTRWNPWFVLVAVIIPVCPLLARICAGLTIGIWPSLWMNLHHGISYRTGLSTDALLSGLFFQGAALVTWSWTSGFALGTLSRRTIWVSGTLFFGLFITMANDGWLFSGGFSWSTGWAWLPFLINFLFVLLPAYCGIRQSSKCQNIEFSRMILLALWTMTMGGLALWTQGWGQAALDNWSRGGSALTLSQLARDGEGWKVGIAQALAAALLTSPIFYVFAQTAFIRKHTSIN
jgi:hypothetical protein